MIHIGIIRLSCILAIAGGVLNIVSDLLLFSGPVSGETISLEFLGTMPFNRTLAGAVLGGALAIPLWSFITIPLYFSLHQAGKWFAIPILLLFGEMVILSSAYHSAYALYNAGFDALANAGPDSIDALSDMTNKFVAFKDSLGTVWLLSTLACSIWLIIAVLFRQTSLPKWLIIWTPVMSVPATLPASFLPAPLGGYITPIASTLAITIFFVLITIITWNLPDHMHSEK